MIWLSKSTLIALLSLMPDLGKHAPDEKEEERD
jgi:hypothetical protein